MAVLFVTATGASLRIATRLLIVLLMLTSLINVAYLGSHMWSLHPTKNPLLAPSGLFLLDATPGSRRTSSVDLSAGAAIEASPVASAPSPSKRRTTTTIVVDDEIEVEDSSSEYDANKDLDDRFSEGHDEVASEEEEEGSESAEDPDGGPSSGEDVGAVEPLPEQLQQEAAGRPRDDEGESLLQPFANVVYAKQQSPQDENANATPKKQSARKYNGNRRVLDDDQQGDGRDDAEILLDGNDKYAKDRGPKHANGEPAETTDSGAASHDGDLRGKEPVLSLLERAGIQLADLDADTLDQLPTWEQIQSLYYPSGIVEPIVHGLETCESYRHSVPVDRQFFGVAGLFNMGTNALDWALSHNIEGRMTRWQVPWGKHRLAKVKWNHTVQDDWGMDNKTNVMPIVILKDPFTWLQSMCGSPYSTVWRHSEAHCPNLVPGDYERAHYPLLAQRESVPVRVEFDKNTVEHWDSLVHLWNDWYRQYYQATYPRLLVRFEDLLFLPEQLLDRIADCVDTELRHPVQHRAKAAKDHGSNTDLVHAIIKHGGNAPQFSRTANMTADDLDFADRHLDPILMRRFQYRPARSSSGSFSAAEVGAGAFAAQ